MPTVPKQDKCSELGCKNPKSKHSGFCLEHGGKDTLTQAPSENRRWFNAKYATPFWRVTRARYLSTHPICAACNSRGHVTPSTVVDHVFPWSQIGEDAFQQNLFQTLCHDCHAHKTKLEQRGVYRHWHNGIATDFGSGDYSRIFPTADKLK